MHDEQRHDATEPPRRDPRLEIPEVLRERPVSHAKSEGKRGPIGGNIGELGMALAIGVDFLVVACAGGGLGWFLDQRFGWSPWGLLIGICLGFGGGLYRLIKRLEKQDRESKRARGGTPQTPSNAPREAPPKD